MKTAIVPADRIESKIFSAPLESPPRDSSEIVISSLFLVGVLKVRDSDGAEINFKAQSSNFLRIFGAISDFRF